MADSSWCLAETNTILESNYPQFKNKLLQKAAGAIREEGLAVHPQDSLRLDPDADKQPLRHRPPLPASRSQHVRSGNSLAPRREARPAGPGPHPLTAVGKSQDPRQRPGPSGSGEKMRFPGGAGGKTPACRHRRWKRLGFDLWVRKIPWSRKQQLLPGEPHDREACCATVHGVAESQTTCTT